MVTLAGFVQFWGWIFIATTLYVWLEARKKELNGADVGNAVRDLSSLLPLLPPPPPLLPLLLVVIFVIVVVAGGELNHSSQRC